MSPDKISRRATLKGATAVTVSASVTSTSVATQSMEQMVATDAADSNGPDLWTNSKLIEHTKAAKVLLNKDRAYQIMDKYGLDGLVAATPLNIYYLSSHSGIMQWMGRHFSTYAFFPRSENAEAALVVPAAMLYHLDYRPTWVPSVQVYTMPKHTEKGVEVAMNAVGDPEAVSKVSFWPVREGAVYNDRDKLLMAIFAEYNGKTNASALYALKKAITEGSAAKGRLGFDDPRVLPWLNDAGLTDLTGLDAMNIFKEIRMVKTENEIDLLRMAAQKNETALDYAIGQIKPGLALDDIELAHARKWSELEGHGKWLITNVNGLNSGVVASGDFMKIDCVGVYKGYHGDVGRTVMVGNPSDELMRRIEANTEVSRTIYETIRPGMSFAEAGKMFTELMHDWGVELAFASPHNVGLEHTDQPVNTGGETSENFDSTLTFEHGTVFTLDMPYNEIGWGTTHVEDMIAVRKDGFEALSSMDTSLRIRPA